MQRLITIGDKSHEISSDDLYLSQMPPVFEPAMVRLFRALITPGMTVLDIGANIGMTALLFSQLARQVYAFEPAPSTYGLLQGNLAAARVANVETFNIGLGEVAQNLTLTFASQNRSGGFVSQHVRPEAGYTTENIVIGTLDGIYGTGAAALPLAKPDFIKMDVEGFEPHVIRGGRRLLAARKPVVVLELNHFCLNVLQRITLPDFFDLLRSVFPVLFAIGADNRSIGNLHDPDTAYNVMHAHVTQFHYPNIVAGFDPAIVDTLAALSRDALAS